MHLRAASDLLACDRPRVHTNCLRAQPTSQLQPITADHAHRGLALATVFTHLVMSPLEFMQRLAALVPRPRLHLIRFHGVLAPNAKLRALVVPQGPEVQEQATDCAVASECAAETVQSRPHGISWARLLKRVFGYDIT